MQKNFLPLNAPSFSSNEKKYLNNCIDTAWVSTAGGYVNEFESKVSSFTGSKFAVAFNSGTAALQIALQIIGVKEKDEVIIPTITFIAPVNAINYNRAKPIFIDTDDFCNIDVEKLKNFIEKETYFKNGYTFNKKNNNRIRAIIPVHVWGNASNLEPVLDILNERNIGIVEDASESLGTFYSKGNLNSKHTGTIGQLGCLSFNGNKIITSGGGGMILTNDKKIAEKVFYLSNQAKDDSIKFIHNEVGYNYRLTNIQAAIGLAQLEKIDSILQSKKRIHENYIELFNNPDQAWIMKSPAYSRSNNWMNILMINEKLKIDINNLLEYFATENIETRPIWLPNHLQLPYRACERYMIKNAENIINNSLCIPSSSDLKSEDLDRIYKTFKNYLILKGI